MRGFIHMHPSPPRHPFPSFAYMPGVDAAHDHAALAPVLALVPARFEACVPFDHPALRYGLALNDAGFFWESHEVLEAVWKVAPQGGRDRILLRACIQIANANLKLRMNRPGAVTRLFREALAELRELTMREASEPTHAFARNFNPLALIDEINQRLIAADPEDRPVKILAASK